MSKHKSFRLKDSIIKKIEYLSKSRNGNKTLAVEDAIEITYKIESGDNFLFLDHSIKCLSKLYKQTKDENIYNTIEILKRKMIDEKYK